MVKKSLLIIMIVCMFVLVGCGKDVQPNNSTLENEEVVMENKEPVYYFYNNRFMGSLENGSWYSPLAGLNENLNVKQWEYSKLLEEEKYYVYGNNTVSDTNKIGVSLEPGIGAFVEFSEKSDAYVEAFKNFAFEEKDYISTFELPIKLEGELVELKSSFENADFHFENADEESIVTNSSEKIEFVDADENFEVTADVNDYLNKYFESNNLNSEIEYILEYSYTADVNGDGKEDKIYAFNSSDIYVDEINEINNIVKEDGQFALIVAEIEDEFIKLYDSNIAVNASDEQIFDRSRVVRLDVADLDNNNDYECIYTVSIPGGVLHVFADYRNGTLVDVTSNYLGH